MDYRQFEGHTPAEEWTTYSMGADNPYHAVRIGGEGFDLPITKGADARLVANAPKLLAKAKRLDEVKRYADSFKKYPTVKKINLKQLRGVIDEGYDFEAEEFGADTHYRNYDGYFANKPELENLHRCITNYLRNERPIRDSLQGDLEYESFDDRFRQSLMDAIRQIEGKLSYGAEEFGAEEYFEYHVYVVDDDEIGDMYIVDNARDFETKEEAIKAAHEVSKDERGKGKTVYIVAEDRENDYEEVFYEINEEGDVMMAEDFGADEYKGKQIYTQLNEFLSQFKKISIKGKPYIVVYEWDNYYEVYPLTEVYGFMGAIRSKLKQWENHKGYAPQKIITKKGYAQPTQNYYDMRTGKWVEDNAWTYEYAGKPGTQAEVRELITYSNYNAEEFGAEGIALDNDMFGSTLPSHAIMIPIETLWCLSIKLMHRCDT